jgi:hypothetical protein
MPAYIQILRWIAVLPGAIIAAVLSLFPLHILLYLVFTRFVEVYPEMPERILAPAILSGVFIWVGSKISPAYKLETAVVLFGIWMFLVGGFVFLTFFGSEFYGGQLYFQYGGIPVFMSVIGSIVGLFVAWSERKKEANNNSTVKV